MAEPQRRRLDGTAGGPLDGLPLLAQWANCEVRLLVQHRGHAVEINVALLSPLFKPVHHRLGETAFHLHPGDALLLYTDGITEARDEAGLEFGEVRVAAELAATHRPPPRRPSATSSTRRPRTPSAMPSTTPH
ncbi:hypothetical protein Afe04nite_20000 [Asanoa ferruginea]|uniref:SpoIIE family protein phosphatase n=1 Tax=Asanoa ferruginea TaxID=53367 RepID=UPI001A55DF59|nr:SpoIIE family protein phosphatase [Asanoa ferruginea]GIF47461.1 hypothetical protein Afe04nite_20000 [Asanoa ferruginea]